MKSVRALSRGFYGGMIREPGSVFDVADGETASWFVSADTPTKPASEVVADTIKGVFGSAVPPAKTKGKAEDKPAT